MLKFICSSLIFLSFLTSSYTQELELFEPQYIVSFRPTSLIGSYPRIGIAFEYRPSQEFSYSLDLGFADDDGINSFFPHANDQLGYKFYEIRPEIKYFLRKRIYVGIEGFYSQLVAPKEMDFIKMSSLQGGDISYESAIYMKRKIGMHCKVGMKVLLNKYIDLDVFVGLGGVNRLAIFEDIVVSTNDYVPIESFFNSERKERNDTALHATIGLKVGYIFRKKTKTKK